MLFGIANNYLLVMIKLIKKRSKRSFLWKIPLEELKNKVKISNTLTEILSFYGLENKGGNSHTLKRRLIEEHIDFSHMKMGVAHNKGRNFGDRFKLTKEECLSVLFVKNSKYLRKIAREYLKRYMFIPYICKCGLIDSWNNEKLTLQLEHKNGNGSDHSLDNLQWLCPNCHSQTNTFAGRNKKKIILSVNVY